VEQFPIQFRAVPNWVVVSILGPKRNAHIRMVLTLRPPYGISREGRRVLHDEM
jgi:hypothetical protein